jgi:hypothetical protein
MLKVSNARLSAEDTAILENSLSAKAR